MDRRKIILRNFQSPGDLVMLTAVALMVLLGTVCGAAHAAHAKEIEEMVAVSDCEMRYTHDDFYYHASGFHPLNADDKDLLRTLRAASPAKNLPLTALVRKQIYKSVTGNYYFLEGMEGNEYFGVFRVKKDGEKILSLGLAGWIGHYKLERPRDVQVPANTK